MVKIYGYRKCSTVTKCLKFFNKNEIEYEFLDVVKEGIQKEKLKTIIEFSGYGVNDFFNKGGNIFKELNLRDRLDDFTYEEKISLFMIDGKMIKRPIIIFDDQVFLGFDEEKLCEYLKL